MPHETVTVKSVEQTFADPSVKDETKVQLLRRLAYSHSSISLSSPVTLLSGLRDSTCRMEVVEIMWNMRDGHSLCVAPSTTLYVPLLKALQVSEHYEQSALVFLQGARKWENSVPDDVYIEEDLLLLKQLRQYCDENKRNFKTLSRRCIDNVPEKIRKGILSSQPFQGI